VPWNTRAVTEIRDELRIVNAVYRSARAQRRFLIWRAASEGVSHSEIAEIVGVTRSSVSQIVRAINEEPSDYATFDDE